MNKKLFYTTIFFFVIITFSFFIPSSGEKEDKKQTILSTTVMIDSLVKEIVEDKFSVELLMEGEIDPHSYQMRKGDKEKIEKAAVIFANGLSLEHNPSLFYLLNDRSAVFLGDLLFQSNPEYIITNNSEVDPHIWMDLDLMMHVADIICEKVSELDPENASFFAYKTIDLKQKMFDLDQKIIMQFQSVPDNKRFLVSSHDAFNYFVRRYFDCKDRDRLFSMQGLSTESEISLKRIRQVIDYITDHDIPVVFYESNLPKDGLFKVIEICKGFGLDVQISKDPLYGDTLGGLTYLQMMEYNAATMARQLKREKKL